MKSVRGVRVSAAPDFFSIYPVVCYIIQMKNNYNIVHDIGVIYKTDDIFVNFKTISFDQIHFSVITIVITAIEERFCAVRTIKNSAFLYLKCLSFIPTRTVL